MNFRRWLGLWALGVIAWNVFVLGITSGPAQAAMVPSPTVAAITLPVGMIGPNDALAQRVAEIQAQHPRKHCKHKYFRGHRCHVYTIEPWAPSVVQPYTS